MLSNYKITFFSLLSYLHTSKGRAGDKCQGWDNLGNYLDVWLKHFFFLSQSYYLSAFNFFFFFFKDFIYLFLDRGEGREKVTERNIDW